MIEMNDTKNTKCQDCKKLYKLIMKEYQREKKIPPIETNTLKSYRQGKLEGFNRVLRILETNGVNG